MKTLEEIRKTRTDVYVINGEQYLLRDDVKLLLRGEDVPLRSGNKSKNRFDIPVDISFR